MEGLSEAPRRLEEPFLCEVEAHGHEGHAKEDVEGAEDELRVDGPELSVLVGVTRHEVTESNGHERDEAEVRPVQVVPTLPPREQE